MSELQNFRRAKLPRNVFRGMDLSHSDFTEAILFGGKFQHCIIKSSILMMADLQGANFTGADCEGSDFSGADLSDAILDTGIFRKCKFDGAIFSETSILHADFTGSTFISSDLRFQDLSRAEFMDCDFTDAKFL